MRYASLLFLAALLPGAIQALEFNRDIRPLLSEYCFACHGPDHKHNKADLHLDSFGTATENGAIVPGKPDESEVILRMFSDDPDEIMPPPEADKRMTVEERNRLKQWIAEGATYEEAWAYVPPKPSPKPEVRDASWPRNWIDHEILAHLEQEGHSPAPDAAPHALLRRLSFDLTGLPPTPKAVAAFEADPSPAAYEKHVDRLLASEAFGERMAMFWLDLVRYADTVGYHGDQDHNISPYRDYVIDAYNRNLPFDQFTREQLAGDLLPEPTLDQRIATGYNRLLQTSHEGGVQTKEYLAIYAADRVRNVSAVWMGATVGCAQCHDHKYDPYTAGDFYRLAAFFADVDEAQHFKKGTNSLPTKRPPEIPVLSRRDRERLATLAPDSPEAAAIKQRERLTMVTQAIEPREMRILARGDWQDDSGPLVEPAIPGFMGTLKTEGRATRLDLATWFTDADKGSGGLTARVFANRYWALLFGSGISRSLDDFGGQGEPPLEYPELLDKLALSYLANWDTKAFLKQLVMSRAYQQSSEATDLQRERDPHNQLVDRQTSVRLPAEMIRDNALAISGLLVREVGGPSAKPYQPGGYYRHLNFPARTYKHHADQQQWRRGVYVHWQRMFLHPMLKAFDAPSREECTAQRPISNTPTAALVMLNDPSFVEAARHLASRILNAADDDPSRLTAGFRLATSRSPDAEEEALLQQLLDQQRASYKAAPDAAKALLEAGQSPAPDTAAPEELAAWTSVARALLNLDETMTRN